LGIVNIVFVSSEVVPLAKTGGLADVCGALPIELSRRGHRVSVVMPAYRDTLKKAQISDTRQRLDIPIGQRIVSGDLLTTQLPQSNVPVYLIRQPDYFDRPGLYGEQGADYRDNCERFVFLCRAALETIRSLDEPVDVIHCHDWQTGLIPAYLNIEYRHARGYSGVASVFTIHNLAYQGCFWHWDMLLTGLDWKYFNWRQLEFFGQLSFLKSGLVYADMLTTVSPNYAREIQETEQGCGLDGVLRDRADTLRGIVNGVDYGVWNPATDLFLPKQFDHITWREGKAACKAALQRELKLPVDPYVPLIGLVGRLADQKGWDLVRQVMEWWMPGEYAQWVVLGTGQPEYHELLGTLAETHPGKIAARFKFDEGLAHRIEAASDMFLMPSRFEPCGLNQLYSLKYGAVPVVRATGGLADTVVDAAPENIRNRTATGFRFDEYDAAALDYTLRTACQSYRYDRDLWEQLVQTGMTQDWSWRRSADEYVKVYEQAVERKRKAAQTVG
jgi:starch synthase